MIQTRNLAVRRGQVELTYPDVTVAQGDVLLLRGPSGCGKSTWMALVAGLLKPDRGRLRVAEFRLAGRKGEAPPTGPQVDAWRALNVGVLPQRLHLSPSLTVADNLALAYFAAGLPVDAAAIHDQLAALGVAPLAHRWPHTLSGGQAQRVALARAVLLQPRVLLADEPTASLDDEAAHAAMTALVDTAARTGATLAVATHDERMVSALGAWAAQGRLNLDVLMLHRTAVLDCSL